jgi:hypothetical protein
MRASKDRATRRKSNVDLPADPRVRAVAGSSDAPRAESATAIRESFRQERPPSSRVGKKLETGAEGEVEPIEPQVLIGEDVEELESRLGKEALRDVGPEPRSEHEGEVRPRDTGSPERQIVIRIPCPCVRSVEFCLSRRGIGKSGASGGGRVRARRARGRALLCSNGMEPDGWCRKTCLACVSSSSVREEPWVRPKSLLDVGEFFGSRWGR